MQDKIRTLLSVLVIVSGAWLSPSAFGQTNTLTIRQEKYTFKMPVTQTVTADTFVIAEDNTSDTETYSKNDKNIGSKKVNTIDIETVAHFQLDSAVFTPSEADTILSTLSEKKLKKTPLVVTGYTCSLGSNEHNQTLSLQRAKAVAVFLRKHGFTVATVQGKGSQNPVTNDPRLFRLNRRVTVGDAE